MCKYKDEQIMKLNFQHIIMKKATDNDKTLLIKGKKS